MKLRYPGIVAIATVGVVFTVTGQQPAKDPGVRAGAAGAGAIIGGMPPDSRNLFAFLTSEFTQLHSVTGALPNESGNGLGPGCNANGCGTCHSFPAIGGSSPQLNPQLAQATLDGATNTIPSFLSINGPVREARFVRNADGTPDGGVHNLFTIKGRVDAPGCKTAQPDFNAELAKNNVVLRIPAPMFGAGLIENISDATILTNKATDPAAKAILGISGHENRSANDGSMTRFGWKAQNKSLMMFSGEAYNVEMGVTNDLFTNERNGSADCNFNNQPEDHLVYSADVADGASTSGMQHFATFGRLLAAPVPAAPTATTQRGNSDFTVIGCSKCHSLAMRTDASDLSALSHQTANLFSDLLVHHMGTDLADGIQQGNAGPDEFRTAPLWGLGQRIFFLHDGRTSDLVQVILAHRSPNSEANKVIANYLALTETQKQDLLDFLRSL